MNTFVKKVARMRTIPTPAVAQHRLRSRFVCEILLSRWLKTLASSARLRVSRYLCSHACEHMGILSAGSLNRSLRVGLWHTVHRVCASVTLVAAHFAGFEHHVSAGAEVAEV